MEKKRSLLALKKYYNVKKRGALIVLFFKRKERKTSFDRKIGFDGVIEKKRGQTALHDAGFLFEPRQPTPPVPVSRRKAKAADYWQQASNCDRGILVLQ